MAIRGLRRVSVSHTLTLRAFSAQSRRCRRGMKIKNQGQRMLALLLLLLLLLLPLTLPALASAEQRSRVRGKGAHVRAHGWASSRRLAPGEQRRAPRAAGRRPSRERLWLLSPRGK
jgi:hypothetical protein